MDEIRESLVVGEAKGIREAAKEVLSDDFVASGPLKVIGIFVEARKSTFERGSDLNLQNFVPV